MLESKCKIKPLPSICHVPLSSPLHEVVSSNQRREPVEDLTLGTTEGVEKGVVDHTGNGVLSVGRDTIVNDALLLGTTCVELVTSARDVMFPPFALRFVRAVIVKPMLQSQPIMFLAILPLNMPKALIGIRSEHDRRHHPWSTCS